MLCIFGYLDKYYSYDDSKFIVWVIFIQILKNLNWIQITSTRSIPRCAVYGLLHSLRCANRCRNSRSPAMNSCVFERLYACFDLKPAYFLRIRGLLLIRWTWSHRMSKRPLIRKKAKPNHPPVSFAVLLLHSACSAQTPRKPPSLLRSTAVQAHLFGS